MTEIRKHMDLDPAKVKLNVLANLFRLLVDIYGNKKAKENLKKIEGEEIEVKIPALNGSIVIKPHAGRILAEVGESESAIARISFKAKDEKLFDVVEDVIKSSQRWGMLKVFFKYILTRKVGIGGSIRANWTAFKTLMIGDHEMYKRAKKQASM